MIDIMTRLKIHNLADGDVPQAIIAEQCGVGLRSVERILAEPVPTRADVLAGERAGAPRRGRPPKADADLVEKIRQLLAEPKRRGLPATEVLRLARGWGYTGGRSQMSALVKSLRPEPRREPIVLFDGLSGEYTQFDFGECKVRLSDGGSLRVQFFAACLKCSRFMHVMIVPDQQAETLARAVICPVPHSPVDNGRPDKPPGQAHARGQRCQGPMNESRKMAASAAALADAASRAARAPFW